MARIKKPIPRFRTHEEEAAYWDTHSVLEHFDESDFKPLEAKRAKDTPITIRLDSESRRTLEEMANVHKVGPSTMARALINSALEQWKRKQQTSLTVEDAAQSLARPIPDELKQEMQRLFPESKAGSLPLLPEAEVERVGKLLVRALFEAAGYRVIPDSESQGKPEKKQSMLTV